MTRLAQRLAFDSARGEIRDQTRRYLMLRPDVLMGALRGVDGATRQAVLAAFAASVAEHGKDSVLAYLAQLEGDRARLLDAMQEAAADLGWGSWRFERTPAALRLTVRNSPFAAGFGASSQPVCAPIAGMLQAVAEVVFAAASTGTECRCAAAGGGACVFEATPCNAETGA